MCVAGCDKITVLEALHWAALPAGHAVSTDTSEIPAAPVALAEALRRYAAHWPEEAEVVRQFAQLLHDAQDPFERARLAGHFTASSWLVDRSETRVLLTHHRKLERWLQLGGHADGDRDLARVALREAEEESGLSGLRVDPEMFDLDRHWIPERKDVPGHWHYDARYVVHAEGSEDYVVSEESHDLAWRTVESIMQDASSDESMLRMARKWLNRTTRSG